MKLIWENHVREDANAHNTDLIKLKKHISSPALKALSRLSAYNYFKSEKKLGNFLHNEITNYFLKFLGLFLKLAFHSQQEARVKWERICISVLLLDGSQQMALC